MNALAKNMSTKMQTMNNPLREALEEIDRQEEAQRIKELGEQLKERNDLIREMREESLKEEWYIETGEKDWRPIPEVEIDG